MKEKKATGAGSGASVWQALEEQRPRLRQPKSWGMLSSRKKARIGLLLRDAILEGCAGRIEPGQGELLEELLDRVQFEATAQVDGLAVSPFPSARFPVPRFVEQERLSPPEVHASFASPRGTLPGMVVAFVDPRELSFRTFENILPMDRWFPEQPIDLALGEPSPLGVEGAFSFPILAPESTRELLLGLDELGLYVPPLNASSRGGSRFIFHSARLSEALEGAIRKAMPDAMKAGFSHVNPVFRCNRFEPRDDRFHRHFDTPYFDRARGHVSRYTVLLYLTGGRGAPALRLGPDAAVEEIEAMTCAIFDQRHEHEGSPFLDGRKVFLRTELIFEYKALRDSDVSAIGRLFARACYLTGERLGLPELGPRADDDYNRVAEAHWRGWQHRPETSEPFVHKSFQGVHWLANGYDFWFPRGCLSLAECAALLLLDFFNCKIDNEAFRALCEAEAIKAPEPGIAWIPAFLASVAEPPGRKPLQAVDRDSLFPEAPAADGYFCCAFHSADLDGPRIDEVVSRFKHAQASARKLLSSAPVVLMGQTIQIDPEKFLVRGNQIHVLSSQRLEPINFAACQRQGDINPETFLGVKETLVALQPLVPPILFKETEAGYHLMFDFFRNSWSMKPELRDQPVPVPEILSIRVDEHFLYGASPWHEATQRSCKEDPCDWLPGEPPPRLTMKDQGGKDTDAQDPCADPQWLSFSLILGDPELCAAIATNPNLPLDDLCDLLSPRIDFETTKDARSAATIAAWQNPMTPVAMLARPEHSYAASAFFALLWLEHLHGVRLPLDRGLEGEHCGIEQLEERVAQWAERREDDPARAREVRIVCDFARRLATLFSLPWQEDPPP